MARYKGTQASHLYEKSMHTLCTISEQPLLAEASTILDRSLSHTSDNGITPSRVCQTAGIRLSDSPTSISVAATLPRYLHKFPSYASPALLVASGELETYLFAYNNNYGEYHFVHTMSSGQRLHFIFSRLSPLSVHGVYPLSFMKLIISSTSLI